MPPDSRNTLKLPGALHLRPLNPRVTVTLLCALRLCTLDLRIAFTLLSALRLCTLDSRARSSFPAHCAFLPSRTAYRGQLRNEFLHTYATRTDYALCVLTRVSRTFFPASCALFCSSLTGVSRSRSSAHSACVHLTRVWRSGLSAYCAFDTSRTACKGPQGIAPLSTGIAYRAPTSLRIAHLSTVLAYHAQTSLRTTFLPTGLRITLNFLSALHLVPLVSSSRTALLLTRTPLRTSILITYAPRTTNSCALRRRVLHFSFHRALRLSRLAARRAFALTRVSRATTTCVLHVAPLVGDLRIASPVPLRTAHWIFYELFTKASYTFCLTNGRIASPF